MVARRYRWKLCNDDRERWPHLVACLRKLCELDAEMFNALLERWEYINSHTVQRTVWYDEEAWPVWYDPDSPVYTDTEGRVYGDDWTKHKRKSGDDYAYFCYRGKRHVGLSYHGGKDGPTWGTLARAERRETIMMPDKKGRPPQYNENAMVNEIAAMVADPDEIFDEWRALSANTRNAPAGVLWKALKAWFEGIRRKPRRKNPHRHNSFRCRFHGGGFVLGQDRPVAGRNPDKNWHLYIKGVPGILFAKGRFPAEIFDQVTTLDAADCAYVRLGLAGKKGSKEWRAGGLEATIMWYDDSWWLSVCVECDKPRRHGAVEHTVRFDLIDGFALVNGQPFTPAGLDHAGKLQDELDELKAERDTRFPRGRRRSDDEQREFLALKFTISRLAARIARIRHNALHVWTTRLVARSSGLTVIKPAVKRLTQSPHGDVAHWGAYTEPVSTLNRSTLNQAPALAVQMLEYKAAEAGIDCPVIGDPAPVISIGPDAVIAGKKVRKVRREVNKRQPIKIRLAG